MTTALQLKLDDDQISRAQRAVRWHEQCVQGFRTQMEGAYLTGVELCALKDSLPHGQFMLAREQYFPSIPERSCQRYMAFIRMLASKSPTLADLMSNTKMLSEGVHEEHREVLLKTIHDEVDGKAMTQISRDCGFIRDPKDAEHHPRKPVDVEATEAQLDQAANEDWCAIIADVELRLGVLERITPENQDRALKTFLKATALLRTLGKSKKKSGRAKLPLSPDQQVPARGPKQSTWIALRSAEGNINVREDDKLPPKEHRGLTEYEGPFNACGEDHAMAKARMLFPSKGGRHTRATEARLAKEKELHDMGEAYEAAHAAEAPGGKSGRHASARTAKPSAIARARLNAAARTRWANVKEKSTK